VAKPVSPLQSLVSKVTWYDDALADPTITIQKYNNKTIKTRSVMLIMFVSHYTGLLTPSTASELFAKLEGYADSPKAPE
jgi:hypothetical protein